MKEDQKATYGRNVVDYCPQKEDPYCRCITVGGNLINYLGEIGTPTAYMLTYKLLFNSVLSTLYAKFIEFDIKIFYLITPMD